MDSQEFKEIFDKDSGEGTGSTIRDVLSTYEKEMQINEAIINQANEDITGDANTPVKAGYETKQFFVVPTDEEGNVDINDDGSSTPTLKTASGDFYVGYLTEDGVPPNGAPFGSGLAFPDSPIEGEFYLRLDYFPNRLFLYNGRRWIKFEENVRTETPSSDDAQNQLGTFVNNDTKNTINGKEVTERQSLSKALKPKADN
jgi:hypothetical protein